MEKPAVLNELLPALEEAPPPLVILFAPDVVIRLASKTVAASVAILLDPVKSQAAMLAACVLVTTKKHRKTRETALIFLMIGRQQR